jgi:primosomal protein N' (replication factor Y)
LVGFSPSLEAARLIDSSFLTLVSSKQRRPTLAVDSANGELLPSKVFSFVRLAVIEGAVLFLVPSKGYGNAVLCGKCRNVALCNCGGKLHKRSAQSDPECAICTAQFPDWRCNWCQSSQIYITSRGIDRFAEEIGRAFPNHPIVNSSGDHIIRELSAAPSLVVATPGAVPRVELGYAGAVLLQGMRFFGHSDLRSNERAKDLFFETASLISSKGKVCVVIDPGHPIVAALNRWDPTVMARKELLEQEEAHLPPYWRIAVLEIQSTEAMGIVHGLTKARTEKRLPTSTQVMGPFEFASGSSRITLSSPQEDAPEMINFVHELQRKRSISGKSLFTVRVDPYALG